MASRKTAPQKLSPPLREALALHKKYKSKFPKGDASDAMILATANAKGFPSVRAVLLKGTYKDGLVFYTNYLSRKARELESTGRAAIVFFFPEMGRQVRFEGRVEKVPVAMSEAYWTSRPRVSQIGAVASPQSHFISSYAELSGTAKRLEKLFRGKKIPRPQHWGGYVLIPESVEFWKAGVGRLHERFVYLRTARGWTKRWMGP